MLAKPVSRPRRRFLCFSVRGLLVLVLLIGGWLGWLVRGARIQREAVATIEHAKGGVSYDWETTIVNHKPAGCDRRMMWADGTGLRRHQSLKSADTRISERAQL